jgi:hypothetical protein
MDQPRRAPRERRGETPEPFWAPFGSYLPDRSPSVNIDAGRLPRPHANGKPYLQIPLHVSADKETPDHVHARDLPPL